MSPICKLVGRHEKTTITDQSQAYITIPNQELPLFKTHGLAAITASATLVKHEWAMHGFQFDNQLQRFFSSQYPWYVHNMYFMYDAIFKKYCMISYLLFCFSPEFRFALRGKQKKYSRNRFAHRDVPQKKSPEKPA